ncbi:unnamed protein product [Boreogadus saida]
MPFPNGPPDSIADPNTSEPTCRRGGLQVGLIAAACPPRSTKHKQALLRYTLAERAAANAAVGLAAPDTPESALDEGLMFLQQQLKQNRRKTASLD